jgi:hypothetical protein
MCRHVYRLDHSPLKLGRCIGGRHTQTSRWPTLEEYLQVTVDYTVAAARAFASISVAQARHEPGRNFRFVFCSGHASELTYCKNLWIMGPTRRAKVILTIHFQNTRH